MSRSLSGHVSQIHTWSVMIGNSWGMRGATPGQSFFDLTVESEDGQRPIGLGRAGLRFLGDRLGEAFA